MSIEECVLIALAFSFIIALITCLVMCKSMKNVHEGNSAFNYVNQNQVGFKVRNDSFSHRNIQRTRIESSDDQRNHGMSGRPDRFGDGFGRPGGRF